MFSRTLRELRTHRGLSVRQLAALSGDHYSSISRYEHGLEPSEANLAALAAALNVPVARLRGGSR